LIIGYGKPVVSALLLISRRLRPPSAVMLKSILQVEDSIFRNGAGYIVHPWIGILLNGVKLLHQAKGRRLRELIVALPGFVLLIPFIQGPTIDKPSYPSRLSKTANLEVIRIESYAV
jgi:hypothetical protein